ncbi:MAG: ATP-binding cassette domain-containing protein [Bacteroidetes bacterium]|nr:ATP-binding cassette domain-containing protein [Bacteroidota bacterium]
MLLIQNLTVQFGGRYLYQDVSFTVRDRDRIGLAGKNGAGKSTLLRYLAGLGKPEEGQIVMPQEYSIGYLPQDIGGMKGKTVFEETSTAFDEIRALEKHLDEIQHQLETRTDYETDDYMNLVEGLNNVTERLGWLGAASAEADVERILIGLGFARTDFTRKTEEFSGGWQMRIELAKILLRRPSLILLDEPTNHLDIESIQWVESFLKEHPGALIVVSHDRAFLDNVTERTIEISAGKIHDYKAPYSRYLELRMERNATQVAAKKNQDRQIEQTERMIEKFRAKASKAKFAQSLIKKLDKVDRIELDDDDSSAIRFRFPPAPRSGKAVVTAEHLFKSYDEKEVLRDITITVHRGEKIAFVGKNGEGKSTLSKMIAGATTVTSGLLELGANTQLGYYAQDQADKLNGEMTVFETIDDVATGDMRTRVRNLLGCFLFSGEDVDKKVKVLSGGEKSRLALAKLLLDPINLLVLDEPTNHLDLRSKAVLKEALQQYDGTLLVVSHDRDFLRGLTDRVYEFGDGQIKEFIGDIYDYLESKKVENMREFEQSLLRPSTKNAPAQTSIPQASKPGNSPAASATAKGNNSNAGNSGNANAKPGNTATGSSGSTAQSQKAPTAPALNSQEWFQAKKDLERDEKSQRKLVEKHEKRIAELETELAELESKLRDPSFFQNADPQVFQRYENNKAALAVEMAAWEKASEQAEAIAERKRTVLEQKPA